jgi:anaerobic selenocysteine-containing dehydrogenase
MKIEYSRRELVKTAVGGAVASAAARSAPGIPARVRTSVITSKPANDGHLKTGQRTSPLVSAFCSQCQEKSGLSRVAPVPGLILGPPELSPAVRRRGGSRA